MCRSSGPASRQVPSWGQEGGEDFLESGRCRGRGGIWCIIHSQPFGILPLDLLSGFGEREQKSECDWRGEEGERSSLCRRKEPWGITVFHLSPYPPPCPPARTHTVQVRDSCWPLHGRDVCYTEWFIAKNSSQGVTPAAARDFPPTSYSHVARARSSLHFWCPQSGGREGVVRKLLHHLTEWFYVS